MATATPIIMSTHYHLQPTSSSGYPHPASGTSISNIISVEPRKPADDNEPSNCQSLPSISEVISGAKLGPYPPAPSSSMQPDSSLLPSPFAPPHPPYPEAEKSSSPHTLHPTSSFLPRQDALLVSDSPRPRFSNRPPLPPASDRHSSPSSRPDVPPHVLHGMYAHPPPSPLPPVSYQPGQLPPGQVPLPAYPISPGHAVPLHIPGPYDARLAPHARGAVYSAPARYDATVNRRFESWSYQDSLSQIGVLSLTISNFAEAYNTIAQEQHGAKRLPAEPEVSDMLGNIELIERWLKHVRVLVQASIQNERARGEAKVKRPCEEEHDLLTYGDGIKPQYGIIKFEKRGGRAAAPGRCHSCNRIDTPEWRRGPDGARTLCNACGLHYAKLERKRQLKARPIRPNPKKDSGCEVHSLGLDSSISRRQSSLYP